MAECSPEHLLHLTSQRFSRIMVVQLVMSVKTLSSVHALATLDDTFITPLTPT